MGRRRQLLPRRDPGRSAAGSPTDGRREADGRRPFHGLPWTGLLGATAVPAVCDATPGVITHLDLGVVQPRGLVRA